MFIAPPPDLPTRLGLGALFLIGSGLALRSTINAIRTGYLEVGGPYGSGPKGGEPYTRDDRPNSFWSIVAIRAVASIVCLFLSALVLGAFSRVR
jgi:hypothetical protein